LNLVAKSESEVITIPNRARRWAALVREAIIVQ
jgi:hypothetical protein